MESDHVNASRVIEASADAVFGVLADPGSHQAIDGTGWVRESRDADRLTHTGQLFRMGMFHENHPDEQYEMCNEVTVFEPGRAIAWRPGYVSQDTGELEFGGWVWRYDLALAESSKTSVRLTYDWSGASEFARTQIQFPPFGTDHLDNSLRHLPEILDA